MLKNMFFALSVLLGGMFAVNNTANAAIILTQDLLEDNGAGGFEIIGTLSLSLNDDAAGDLFIESWDYFEILGFELDFDPVTGGGAFAAMLDADALTAGLTFLQFDLNETLFNFYAFNGWWDPVNEGYMDIFTTDAQFVVDGFFSLSQARIAYVSEPATVLLMLGALAGFASRRNRRV